MLAHEPDGPVVEVGGVGLLVRVSATTLGALPAVGGEASLLTVLVVREESLDLYGFATAGRARPVRGVHQRQRRRPAPGAGDLLHR